MRHLFLHFITFFKVYTGGIMLEDFKDVLTIEELCDALHIGKRLAYKLVHDGTIPARRIGRIYRIPKSAVLQYLIGTA